MPEGLKFNYLKTIFLALITISVFIFLFQLVDFRLGDILQVNYFWISIATGVTLTFPLLSTARWYFVLKSMGVGVSFGKVLHIIWGTWFLSIFPGRLGDLARSLGFGESIPTQVALGSIILEKIIDVCVLISFSITGLLILGKYQSAFIMVLILMGILISILNVKKLVKFFSVKLFKNKLMQLEQSVSQMGKSKYYLIQATISSTINWFLSITQTVLLFWAVGENISITTIMGLLPLAIFISLIPITIAGMGTRDSAFLKLFGSVAMSSNILKVSIWYSLLGFWLIAILGLPWSRVLFKSKKNIS